MSGRGNQPSKVTRDLFEITADMRDGGLIDNERHASMVAKLTMRGQRLDRVVEPLTGEQIWALREQANMSQAIFAHHLNVTANYISQLERGAKRPIGAAFALLNVIRRMGMQAIL